MNFAGPSLPSLAHFANTMRAEAGSPLVFWDSLRYRYDLGVVVGNPPVPQPIQAAVVNVNNAHGSTYVMFVDVICHARRLILVGLLPPSTPSFEADSPLPISRTRLGLWLARPN
ncbi:hypothetical protein CVT26_015477 [Gymnopilus dilepis]|uniref:Uncharacterized protein n=1 Tax=Gymnopilus dilepis TaxID=231916 RepID=A0A409WA64_9AGAR|nr:hypothetical protein CVT26_015477 [Gymnopilus dilepis]